MNIPLFAQLHGEVTNTAMQKLNFELQRSHFNDYPPACTCKTLQIMGYPCGHQLQRYQAAGECLLLWRVHRHWRFEPRLAEDRRFMPNRVVQAPRLRRQLRQTEPAASSYTSTTGEADEVSANPKADEEDQTHERPPLIYPRATQQLALQPTGSQSAQSQHLQLASSARKRTLRSG